MEQGLHAKRMLAARRMRSPLVWSGGFSIFLLPTHRTERLTSLGVGVQAKRMLTACRIRNTPLGAGIQVKRIQTACRMRNPLVWTVGFSVFLLPHTKQNGQPPLGAGVPENVSLCVKLSNPFLQAGAHRRPAQKSQELLLAAFARYMRPANRARERSRYLALIALRRSAG